ncbi:MAG: hypothetical protein WAU23_03805 [Ferruginibacter sp.]
MYRLLLFLIFLLSAPAAFAQLDSLSKEDRRLLDSMFNNDEFIKLMMKKEKSFVDVNIGMGNRLFSISNNSLNAGQSQTDKIYYKPSVGYFHKSGLAIALSGYLASDNGKLKSYQYAVSPSYTFSNKKFTAGISYTRFFEDSVESFTASPFKNDFFASATYKKTWLRPAIAVGYAFGKQTEYFDTSFWFFNRVVHLRDTITTKLSAFSLTLSASHQWSFYELLGKKDAFQLQPAVLFNAGSQRWNIAHSNSFFGRRPVIQNYLKQRFGDGSESEKFNLQSVALSVLATYYYGRFYLQPQLYLDYYLPTTTEKRLTSLFSLTAGVTFD